MTRAMLKSATSRKLLKLLPEENGNSGCRVAVLHLLMKIRPGPSSLNTGGGRTEVGLWKNLNGIKHFRSLRSYHMVVHLHWRCGGLLPTCQAISLVSRRSER